VGNALFFPYHQFSGMKVSQRVSRDCLIVFELGKPLVQPTLVSQRNKHKYVEAQLELEALKESNKKL
jgi:hypothetical protein